MSLENIDRMVVPPAEQRSLFFAGKPVRVPAAGVECDVLTLDTITESLYLRDGVSKQLVLGDVSGNSVPFSQPRSSQERVVAEYSLRASGCIDGSCEFIEQTPDCFRRPENSNPN